MNYGAYAAFILAAIALLGSPGPAIAALLAVGRAGGWRGGLLFFGGLQLGLASAAGLTILGLFAALAAFPQGLIALSLIATSYLLFLAYQIATAHVGAREKSISQTPTAFSGFFLGITNPKAYLAFASLFASFQIFTADIARDSFAKWIGVVVVMISVDMIWLWIGVRLGRLSLSDRTELLMNYTLAAAIVLSAVLTLR